MRYNQKLLDNINLYTFNNFIYDNGTLAKYINCRLYCLNDKSDSILDDDLLLVIRYEMNITRKIKNMQPLDKLEIKYLEYMLNECTKNPILLHTFPMFSELLKNNYDIGYHNRIILNETNNKFISILDDVNREKNEFDYYIKSREYLSKKSNDPTKYRKFPLLTKYFALYIDHYDEKKKDIAKDYFSYLINSHLCTGMTNIINSSYEAMFISKYLYCTRMYETEKSFKAGFNGKIKMEHDNLAFLYCNNKKPNTMGYFSSSGESIYINSKNKDIISIMLTVIHEISHYGQYLKASNAIISDEAFEYALFIILGSRYGRDSKTDYERNYSNQEIEHEANIRAYNYLIDYFNDTCDSEAMVQIRKIILNYINKKYQSSVTVRKSNDDGAVRNASLYKFDLLDDEMRYKSSYYFSKFPILKYFYNINGTRKDYIEILKESSKKRELSNALFQSFENLSLKKKIDGNKIFNVDNDDLPQLLKGLDVMLNEILRFFDNVTKHIKMYHSLNNSDRLKINSMYSVYEECRYLYHFISSCRNDLISQKTQDLIDIIGVRIAKFTP